VLTLFAFFLAVAVPTAMMATLAMSILSVLRPDQNVLIVVSAVHQTISHRAVQLTTVQPMLIFASMVFSISAFV
jgi:uncharacterized membrane protein